MERTMEQEDAREAEARGVNTNPEAEGAHVNPESATKNLWKVV